MTMDNYEATYGDLLRRIGMIPGDVLHVLTFHKNKLSTEAVVEIGRFRARTDTPLNTMLQDMEENYFFEYSGEIDSYQTFTFTDNQFNFIIGNFDDDPDYSLACIAFMNYRETDSKPQFSSSQFRWFNSEWWKRYGGYHINVCFESWKEQPSQITEG